MTKRTKTLNAPCGLEKPGAAGSRFACCRPMDRQARRPNLSPNPAFNRLPVLFETTCWLSAAAPPGLARSVAAARAGAKVAIIERWPILGGLFHHGPRLHVAHLGPRSGK